MAKYDKNGDYAISVNNEKMVQGAKDNAINNRTNDNNKRINKQNSFISSLSIGGILKFVLIILLLSMLVRVITNRPLLTFQSFFESVINNAYIINLDFVNAINNLTITGDWGVLNFLKDFLNTNISFLSGGFMVLTLLLNGIIYVFSFISWVFLI